MEGWRDRGRDMEGWRDEVKTWTNGGVEGGRNGEVERWRGGGVGNRGWRDVIVWNERLLP